MRTSSTMKKHLTALKGRPCGRPCDTIVSQKLVNVIKKLLDGTNWRSAKRQLINKNRGSGKGVYYHPFYFSIEQAYEKSTSGRGNEWYTVDFMDPTWWLGFCRWLALLSQRHQQIQRKTTILFNVKSIGFLIHPGISKVLNIKTKCRYWWDTQLQLRATLYKLSIILLVLVSLVDKKGGKYRMERQQHFNLNKDQTEMDQ